MSKLFVSYCPNSWKFAYLWTAEKSTGTTGKAKPKVPEYLCQTNGKVDEDPEENGMIHCISKNIPTTVTTDSPVLMSTWTAVVEGLRR